MLPSSRAAVAGESQPTRTSAALAAPAADSLPERSAAPGGAPSHRAADSAAASREVATRRTVVARLRRRRWLLRLISPVAVLGLWQLVSTAGLISAQKLPPPTQVWSTAVWLATNDSAAYGTLQGALLVSLQRVAIGFAAGGTVGLLLSVCAGLSRLGENAVDPLMQMLRTLPLYGLIPVFIVWFGIGSVPKITLIALGAAVPLYLNTFSGIRNVDPKLAELSSVLGLRRRELIFQIVLPGAMPQILVGLRQSLGVAWLALVVAEQINANAGLGFIISQATEFLRNDVIFVALLVYCVLGLITDWLVRVLERRALSWRSSFVAA